VISGTPGVTAGTFTPKVTLAYNDGSRSVSFSWKVSSAAGQLKGYDAKCLGDTGTATRVLGRCAAAASQEWTLP